MKIFNRYLILSLFLGLFLFSLPKAYAGTCAWGTDLAGLSGCCETSNSFFSCIQPASGKNYVMNVGGSLTCKLDTAVKSSYLDPVNTNNWSSFDCATGGIDTSCRTGYCKNSSNVCTAITGAVCTAGLNRNNICPGGCGSCKSGNVYCVNNQPTNIPDELGVGTLACQAMDYGPGAGVQASGAAGSCAALGKDVANPCTGECTECSAGKTPSGRNLGMCVTYATRFTEIFEDGFTYFGGKVLNLGGVTVNNAYSYGSYTDTPKTKLPSDPYFYGDVFTEVDQADHLNWSSSTVPAVLQGLIANAGYQFCSASSDPAVTGCPAGQICTAGICNNPTNTGEVGDACTNSSSCNLGLLCDSKTLKCINPFSPENELVACTDNSQCAGQPNGATSCVLGFCRNQTNGLGAACPTGLDSQCAAGLICNASLICVSATDTTSRFVGLTTSLYAGAQTDYKNADNLCSTAYAGSHVCWSKEVVASYLANVPTLTGVTGFAWVNSAAPGNQYPLVNDCNGWNMATPDSDIYGTIWSFNGKFAGIGACEMPFKFSCCK